MDGGREPVDVLEDAGEGKTFNGGRHLRIYHAVILFEQR